MKTNFILFIVLCFGLTSLAQASSEQQNSDTQIIKFEDLKVACTNPSRYHNQVAPSNIQISCSEARTKWIPDPKAAVSLPTKRIIITSVISNKYTVSPVTVAVPSDPQSGECSQYKQVIETVEAVHTGTCEALMTFKGTGEEYCASNIDALRTANPESVRVQDTGKRVSFCDSKVQD